jgi:hypothetical protein
VQKSGRPLGLYETTGGGATKGKGEKYQLRKPGCTRAPRGRWMPGNQYSRREDTHEKKRRNLGLYETTGGGATKGKGEKDDEVTSL